jgi:hypothetical protein
MAKTLLGDAERKVERFTTEKTKDVNVAVRHMPTTYVFEINRDSDGLIKSIKACPQGAEKEEADEEEAD